MHKKKRTDYMKGIIFDLDGTLLNTVPDLLWSMNSSLKELGYNTVTEKQLISYIGNGAKMLVTRCLGNKADEKSVEKLFSLYGKVYSENLFVRTEYYTGVREMLSSLVADGIKTAVLSNKPDEQTKRIIAHFFPEIPFVCVRGKSEGFPLKPDPFSALAIAAQMKLDPVEVVFVGDSPEDFRTAENAGMKSVSVLWGYRDKSAYDGLSQTNFASDPGDLISVLQTI